MQKKSKIFTTNYLSIFLVICGAILFFGLVINLGDVVAAGKNLYSIIAPFVAAIAVAYLLNRPMMFFERTILKKIKKNSTKRILSIIIVYFLTAVTLFAVLSVVIPQLGVTLTTLWSRIQEFITMASVQIPLLFEKFNLDPKMAEMLLGSWESFFSDISEAVTKIVPQVVSVSFNISYGVIQALMTTFAVVYILASKEILIRQVKKIIIAVLPYRKSQKIFSVATHSNRVFSDFIVGKILDSFIIGIICFIGMQFIYQPYSLLISIIIGVTNIIPFFGPFIGAIPSTLILLIADPLSGLIFLIFVIALQQFDGNYLGPRILGNSTGLSPLWVLISITVGGGLFGFIGMLIGVPTFSVIYTLFKEFVHARLVEKGVDENGILIENFDETKQSIELKE